MAFIIYWSIVREGANYKEKSRNISMDIFVVGFLVQNPSLCNNTNVYAFLGSEKETRPCAFAPVALIQAVLFIFGVYFQPIETDTQ